MEMSYIFEFSYSYIWYGWGLNTFDKVKLYWVPEDIEDCCNIYKFSIGLYQRVPENKIGAGLVAEYPPKIRIIIFWSIVPVEVIG